MVNGMYPESSQDLEKVIKQALLTMRYDASLSDSTSAEIPFSVNVSGTDFKAVKTISGALAFTTDGKIPTDKPSFIVGSSVSKIATPDRQKFAEDRLKKLPRREKIYQHGLSIQSFGKTTVEGWFDWAGIN